LLAALAALACVGLRGPLELQPHFAPAPPAVQAGGTAQPPPLTGLRLALAPFRDARIPLSRAGVRPAPRLTLLGVARIGEYATGDASFAGALAEHARRDAAATLAHSGLFAQVRLLDPGALVAAGRSAWDWDLVLQAEIEELVGLQNRRFELNLLRLPPLRNQVEPPLGIARVRYRVLDANGELRFEQRIETQLGGRGYGLARAALDALAAAHERLAQFLFRVFAPPRGVREVPLLALDACGLGERRLRELVTEANEVFEREAQLRLVPRIETWQRPTAASTPRRALRLLKRTPPPPGGIVLGLLPYTTRRTPWQREPSGLATQLGEHAVLSCGPDTGLRTVTLLHEIGHLLGAVHVGERSSIMYPVAEFDGRFFDVSNRRILRASRARDFGAPLPEALRGELRALYQELADADAAPAADLRAALQAVAL
jgi:hypothetical protein